MLIWRTLSQYSQVSRTCYMDLTRPFSLLKEIQLYSNATTSRDLTVRFAFIVKMNNEWVIENPYNEDTRITFLQDLRYLYIKNTTFLNFVNRIQQKLRRILSISFLEKMRIQTFYGPQTFEISCMLRLFCIGKKL